MDPASVANIEEQVELAREIIDEIDRDEETDSDGNQAFRDKANRLAELVLVLHEWRRGGLDPYAKENQP